MEALGRCCLLWLSSGSLKTNFAAIGLMLAFLPVALGIVVADQVVIFQVVVGSGGSDKVGYSSGVALQN